MGIFQKLTGIIGSTFQIGGTSGPILKNNSGAVEAKNAADNAFVPVNAGTPTAWGNNAVVTATMLQQAFIVGAEFDGATPPRTPGRSSTFSVRPRMRRTLRAISLSTTAPAPAP
jgi:hypothetical protein